MYYWLLCKFYKLSSLLKAFCRYFHRKNRWNGQCGTDELIHQSESAKRYLDTVSEGSEAPQIKNTEILRVYRLAIAVAYNRYSDYYFNSDVQKVKDF